MVLATSISVSPQVISLKKNEPQTVTATVQPADALQKVTWSSSNPDAISVDDTGVVKALDTSGPLNGAVIKATTTDGSNLTAQTMVAVLNPKSTGLTNGQIAGIVVGCVIIFILIIVGLVFLMKMSTQTISELNK